jgi:hypothetical protein
MRKIFERLEVLLIAGKMAGAAGLEILGKEAIEVAVKGSLVGGGGMGEKRWCEHSGKEEEEMEPKCFHAVREVVGLYNIRRELWPMGITSVA